MADRDIAVKFTGDSRDLERASEKAESSLAETGKKMGGSLAGLAGPAGIAAAAVAGVGFAAYGMAEAASEDEAAAAALAHQMKTAAGASDEAVAGAEAYISALSEQAALADDELRPALETLVNATGDVGKAQDLLAQSTDIAAGTGKDLEAVVNAVAKGALGSTGGLSKLGLATEDAAGKAMGFNEILDSARGKFAGAGEAAANTTAGGMKKAEIAFGEMQESIGAKLLPVLGAAAQVFTEKVIPAGEALVAWAEEQWPKIMDQLEPALEDLRKLADEVFTELGRLWDEWGDEVTWVVTNVVGVALRGVVEWFKFFLSNIQRVIALVRWEWQVLGAVWRAVSDFIADAVAFLQGVVDRGLSAVRFIVAVTVGVIDGLARVWDAVKWATAVGVNFVVDLMAGIGERIRGALAGIGELIMRPFTMAFNAIADAWNATIGSLSFSFPDWIPGFGGRTIDVPDVPRFSPFAATTIVMPPGTDGYDIARQLNTYSRTVQPLEGLGVVAAR